MKPSIGPIEPGERLFVIDVLRGFAILGILIVNLDSYAWPLDLPRLGWADSAALVDRLAGVLIRLLAEGKFYTMFSFLFGFGLAVQMARAEARGVPFVPLYARRLLVLLGIGGAHAVLLWYGDILVTYAILGFPLLAFRHSQPRTLMIWVVACWVLPAVLEGLVGLMLLGAAAHGIGARVLEQLAIAAASADAAEVARAIQVYGHGTFAQILVQRLRDLRVGYVLSVFSVPTVFAMFLLGLWVGRRGIFEGLAASRPVFQKTAAWGLTLGGLGNLVYVVGRDLAGDGVSLLDIVSGAAHALSAPALMLGYLASIALLVRHETWRRRLAPLASVGRMALTNYLIQSLICTTLFYSYGFGLYGTIGLAEGLGLAAMIFALEVVASGWWMRRFAYGPTEWLWRSLTYGRPFKARARKE